MTEPLIWIILPFHFPHPNAAAPEQLARQLTGQGVWQEGPNEMRYFLRYVTDGFLPPKQTLEGTNSQRTQGPRRIVHLMANDIPQALSRCLLAPGEDLLYIGASGEPANACLRILEIHIYLFGTGIGLMTLKGMLYDLPGEGEKVGACITNWRRIADHAYNLKRCSDQVLRAGSQPGSEPFSFVQLGIDMLGVPTITNADFFFFAADGERNDDQLGRPVREKNLGRANLLICMDNPRGGSGGDEEEARALFYLRNGEDTNRFTYFDPPHLQEKEILRNSPEVCWGLSPEGMVCLLGPAQSKFQEETFLSGFPKRVGTTYLMMYLLLLHQKYALYQFITDFSSRQDDSLEALLRYREDFYEFRRYYVYSRISDVVQYENLYERMQDVFRLNRIYEDVNEPLERLNQLQEDKHREEAKRQEQLRRAEEQRRSEEQKSIESLAARIGVLCIFSALVDCMGFVQYFGEPAYRGHIWFWTGLVVDSAMFLVVAIPLLRHAFRTWKRKWKNKKQQNERAKERERA